MLYGMRVLCAGALYSVSPETFSMDIVVEKAADAQLTPTDVLRAHESAIAHVPAADIARLKFFVVAHSNPAGRVIHTSSAARLDHTAFSIRTYRASSTDDSQVALELESLEALVFSLRSWCRANGFQAAVTELRRWRKVITAEDVQLAHAAITWHQPVAHRIFDVPEELPSDDDMPLVSLPPTPSMAPAIRALHALEAQYHYRGIPSMVLDLSEGEWDSLRGGGVIAERQSEFGDMEVFVDWRKVSWSIQHIVGEPAAIRDFDRHVSQPEQLSKIEILCVLLSMGWVADNAALELEPTQTAFRLRRLFGTAAYWHCLLKSAVLFANGLPAIAHGQTHHYYLCLLKLPPARSQALLALEDLHLWRDKDFLNVLRGGPLQRAGADAAVPDLDDAPDGGALPPPRVQHRAHRSFMPDKLIIDGVTLTFDNWTHASGERRISAHCRNPAHGPACFKYRQLSKFESLQRAVAWMYCWHKHGSTEPTKAQHRWYFPSDPSVQEAEVMARACLDR